MSAREDREVPVAPCEAWCEVGQEQHRRDHPDDRHCLRTVGGAWLSMHDPLKMNDGKYHVDGIDVRLWRDPGAALEVRLLHEGTDDEVRMTLAEALRLRDVLDDALQAAAS